MRAEILLTIAFTITRVECADILVISPTPAYSHLLYARTIYKELAARGHNVTAFVPFKITNETSANLNEISFTSARTSRTFNQVTKSHRAYIYHSLSNELLATCDAVYENARMRELLASGRFDLVVVEYNVAGCFSALKEHFGAPLVGVRSLYLRLEGHDYLGNPTDASYLPLGYFEHADGFRGRLGDYVFSLFWRLHHYFYTLPKVGRKVRRYFPHIGKSALDLERGVDLVLTNTHHVLNGVRPLVPACIDAGFIHVGKQEPALGKDLQEYLDGLDDGFALFNVGTTLSSDVISDQAKSALAAALGKLPFKILMKFDGFESPPENVRIVKWLPQESVLAHRNIRCFISHGGLLSIQEAIYHEVPLVVIPFIFDQPLNAHRVEHLRIGRRITVEELARPERVLEVIGDVCARGPTAPYRPNIARVSRVIRDQPMRPLDRAVWWIEYVLRNGGMPHGRSDAVHMGAIAYYSLDVVGFMLLCAFVALKICKIAIDYYRAKRIQSKLKLF